MNERGACCDDPKQRPACGTDFASLRKAVTRLSGKGVRLGALQGDEQGRPPFFAQPVGFDGRAFWVAKDFGCDTEKLLHEFCHWMLAPKERRQRQNYGLGPNPVHRVVSEEDADNEEVTVMLLERHLAPHFGLADSKIAKPDYNVYSRHNVDWEACEARAEALFTVLRARLS